MDFYKIGGLIICLSNLFRGDAKNDIEKGLRCPCIPRMTDHVLCTAQSTSRPYKHVLNPWVAGRYDIKMSEKGREEEGVRNKQKWLTTKHWKIF